MPSISHTLRYLYSLERLGINPGLDRIRRLLKILGNPHRGYTSVLIGGTNGKGSTCAMIEAILIASGRRTGLYTSPHLVRFNERIRVCGEEIGDEDVISLTDTLKGVVEAEPLLKDNTTFFEFTTAMAFKYFEQRGVEIAVVEVGMGGRYDATNVLEPVVSAITTVGFDHQRYLGRTLTSIAREKAGIIKRASPVVTGIEEEKPLKIIEGICRRKDAPLYRLGRDFYVERRDGQRFDYIGMGSVLRGIELTLMGRYQLHNAGCALAVVELLKDRGICVDRGAMERGLKGVRWHGRFEVVKKAPLVLLDCAHNPQGMKALKEALGDIRYRRLILVIGVMADKDVDGMLSEIVPLAHTVVVTSPRIDRSMRAGLLARKVHTRCAVTIVKDRVRDACLTALRLAEKGDAVCVTGSIFTVGEARQYLKETIAL